MTTPKNLTLSDDQIRVLEMSLAFYIRLGLGQFSEIALRLNLLHGDKISPEKMERISQLCEEMQELAWGDEKPWNIMDADASIYTLTAYLLESQMSGRSKVINWVSKRIAELSRNNEEKIQ